MRKRLQNIGLQITEISEMMDISRPTLYKYIDMYDSGERDKIDPDVLKLLDHIKRNPRLGKKDILYYVLLLQGSAGNVGSGQKVSSIVTVTAIERPARRMIVLRSKNAFDYLSYCEEMDCKWESTLNGIRERFDDAAIVDLPSSAVTSGTSSTAAGIEVPSDYAGTVPEGYGMIDLKPCTMLYFRGSPYDNEEDFVEAIRIVSDAISAYDPEIYGWKFDPEAGPTFNFGASAEKGARMAMPVRMI